MEILSDKIIFSALAICNVHLQITHPSQRLLLLSISKWAEKTQDPRPFIWPANHMVFLDSVKL